MTMACETASEPLKPGPRPVALTRFRGRPRQASHLAVHGTFPTLFARAGTLRPTGTKMLYTSNTMLYIPNR